MNPKENAVYIYNKVRDELSVTTANVRAKKIALILVEEIIKEGVFMKGNADDDTNLVGEADVWKLDERNTYWETVKDKLIKL